MEAVNCHSFSLSLFQALLHFHPFLILPFPILPLNTLNPKQTHLKPPDSPSIMILSLPLFIATPGKFQKYIWNHFKFFFSFLPMMCHPSLLLRSGFTLPGSCLLSGCDGSAEAADSNTSQKASPTTITEQQKAALHSLLTPLCAHTRPHI